jgi:hypothetical protein
VDLVADGGLNARPRKRVVREAVHL